MDFTYDDEQDALRDAVRGLIGKAYSDYENRRRTVGDDPGFDEKVWAQMAEMGLLGLPFGEDDGGVGAGPVGLSVALWCRFFGAQHIVISDLVAARAERALSLGATSAVDARRDDFLEHVEAVIGARPEIVFDAVGVPGSLQLAIDYAAHDGRLVVVGLCMAGDHLFPTKALVKELDIRFAFIYPQADFATVLELLGHGRVDAKPMISDRIGLGEFSNAFEALKQPNQQIKVMLEPN